jgi:hypothetical protein
MAQKNRANMLTDIVSNIYNNLINFITGQNAQDRFVNLLDSSPNILSDASQPNGYVSTDANNEMFSSYYDEEISRADLISDLTANLAVGGKFYRINDAVGNTITLLVTAESNINLYPFGIDATTGEIGTYDITTDVFSPIVSSAQTLAQTLILGNTSGANDIEFDATQGLLFSNASRLREGTIDAGLGGLKGIAQICGAGYELKWENGRLYVMGSSGNTIRQSLYNFSTAPTTSDDASLGYQDGSLWTLDNGDTYECIDAATGTWVNKGNAYIIEITSTNLAALESAGTLSLTTIYIVTDAPYKVALQAEAVNKIGANGTIIDLTFSGSVYYDLATNTILNGTMSDIDGNTWNGCLPSATTLGGSSTKNTFYQGATSNTLGTGNYLNTFEQDAANNELGINCGANTFKQYANGFIFGGGLQNVTIEANTTGANYTAVGYNFMYSQNYPATIFTDGSVNFHRYFDIPNDRIVVTNLSTLAVSYIGGGSGVASVSSGTNISVDNTDPANPIINSLADRYKTSSTSSVLIGNNSKTFTVDANLAYIPLQEVLIVYDPSNHMHGTVTSYSGTTLVVDVNHHTGGGTFASWVINLDGIPIDAITGAGTANQIAYFTSGQVIASLDTATYPSLTELSYVKGATSAIQTQLNSKVTFFASGADGTASSGTTNTISISVLIPANTFALDDVIRINHRVRATGTTATRETRIYVNTSASLTGATVVSTATLTSTILSANLQRFLAIKNATTNTEVITATSSQLTDYANLTTAVTTLVINWTVDQYIIFAVNALNGADSIRASMYSIEKL